jgi:hypothetical protein
LAEFVRVVQTSDSAKRLFKVAQTNTATDLRLPVHFVTAYFFGAWQKKHGSGRESEEGSGSRVWRGDFKFTEIVSRCDSF